MDLSVDGCRLPIAKNLIRLGNFAGLLCASFRGMRLHSAWDICASPGFQLFPLPEGDLEVEVLGSDHEMLHYQCCEETGIRRILCTQPWHRGCFRTSQHLEVAGRGSKVWNKPAFWCQITTNHGKYKLKSSYGLESQPVPPKWNVAPKIHTSWHARTEINYCK